jgi:predicted DCC family thiol-disulfide oxidoreductase YuxK
MSNQHVIIFDGVCNFCNRSVNFIIKRDHINLFVFAPMQSPAAQKLIADHNVENIGFDTFILIKNDEYLFGTNAAIEIAQGLSGAWYLCRVFKILPRSIRDYFYRLLARNRYSIFGKLETCMLPTKELKNKFLW